MNRCVLSVSLAASSILLASIATATVIYDESVDGDLHNATTSSDPATPTLVLVEGLNQIVGVTTYDVDFVTNTFVTDKDAFEFDLPDNLRLDEMSVDFSWTSEGPVEGARGVFTFYPDPDGAPSLMTRVLGGLEPSGMGSSILFPELFPNQSWGARHELWIRAYDTFGGPAVADSLLTYSYTINLLTVDPVPEPTSALLLALGLVGLSLTRRR